MWFFHTSNSHLSPIEVTYYDIKAFLILGNMCQYVVIYHGTFASLLGIDDNV